MLRDLRRDAQRRFARNIHWQDVHTGHRPVRKRRWDDIIQRTAEASAEKQCQDVVTDGRACRVRSVSASSANTGMHAVPHTHTAHVVRERVLLVRLWEFRIKGMHHTSVARATPELRFRPRGARRGSPQSRGHACVHKPRRKLGACGVKRNIFPEQGPRSKRARNNAGGGRHL